MQCTEGCEGRCEGDCCRWDHWQGVVTPQGLCQWAIFITDEHTHTHFFSPFIHKVEIKISCCNYCLVRRSNSAKLIASHPSVAIQGIWHQLSFTCSSKLQWKVMVLLCDTSVDRLVSEELPIPTFPLAFPPQLWELVHKKRERERNPPVMSRIMNV